MTTREEIAAMVMQALVPLAENKGFGNDVYRKVASQSLRYADALLAEINQDEMSVREKMQNAIKENTLD